MRINKFFGTIFAFMPGATHMYIGLMRQGIQIMAMFFGTVACTIYFGNFMYDVETILIPMLVVLYCFSFFDGIRKLHSREQLFDGDCFIIEMLLGRNRSTVNRSKLYRVVGYVLIILGLFMMFNMLIEPILYKVAYSLGWDSYAISLFIRNGITSILLIVGGVMILKGKKATQYTSHQIEENDKVVSNDIVEVYNPDRDDIF